MWQLDNIDMFEMLSTAKMELILGMEDSNFINVMDLRGNLAYSLKLWNSTKLIASVRFTIFHFEK